MVKSRIRRLKGFFILVLVLSIILVSMFHNGIEAGYVLNSNDGPFGIQSAQYTSYPGMFSGGWNDLNWLGANIGNAGPSITPMLVWILGPLWFSKIYSLLGLLFLGIAMWFACRQFKLSPMVAGITAIATVLNMNYFSHSAWGLASRATCAGASLMAIGLAFSSRNKFSWSKVILAGFCVGIAVMEGADNGTIFSVYIGVFVGFLFLIVDGLQDAPKKIAKIATLVIAAAILASPVVLSLLQTQISDTTLSESEGKSPEEHWYWATQYSLPKLEAFRIIVPGLFGYRSDLQDGSQYWGTMGRSAGMLDRQTASGEYAGVAVILVAFLSLGFAFRRDKSPYSSVEKKIVFFWAGSALLCLLIALGKHGPIYRAVFALPYFSSIRNPAKFMHPFQISLLLMFAFGLEGIARTYLVLPKKPIAGFFKSLSAWWRTSQGFDKKLKIASVLIFGASLLSVLVYASSKVAITNYLKENAFSPEDASKIFAFSVHEVTLFLLFLGLSLVILICFVAGAFSGKKATLGFILLGIVVTSDLARANAPWVQYYNYEQRYFYPNPVINFLRANTREYRTTQPDFLSREQAPFLTSIVRYFWLGHLYQYYNIQSLDHIQLPREPLEYRQFMGVTNFTQYCRLLQLTSTRWVVAPSTALNGAPSFKPALKFDLANGENGTIITITNGPGNLALFDFTEALPRARIYSSWICETNDASILHTLGSPQFDPSKQVVVRLPNLQGSGDPKLAEGSTVTYDSYLPKKIVLKVHATAPGLLLLNDKFDPNWIVLVDGTKQELLKCNYVMRGVQIPQGNHQVIFE
ncbi:MAG: hypothetical protein JWN25_2726, partial [Verrucomicrobiales bacterium]|nr:hypothetical protein [Verrucomicrobiales bacterium]